MTRRSLPFVALMLQVAACTRTKEASPRTTENAQPTAQVTLCPTRPAPPGVDDLRFSEDQFTGAQFESSYAYFEAELPRQLDEAEKTSELTDREGFWIGYGNRLRLMKGYVLKQAALIEQTGRSSDSTLLRDSTSATFRLCRFLQTKRAVD
jgi:phosphate-selective porin